LGANFFGLDDLPPATHCGGRPFFVPPVLPGALAASLFRLPARPIYWEGPNEQLFFVSQATICVVFLSSRAAQRQKRAFFSIFYVVTKINSNATIKASDGTKLQLTSRVTPLRVISK
jgi:hypothetical protein